MSDRTEQDSAALAHLLDEVDIGIWAVAAASGRTLFVNRALLAITGRSREDFPVEQATVIPWLHPDDQARALVVRRAAFAGETTGHVWRLLRPDGELRWVRFRSHTVPAREGTPAHLDILVDDVTALRQTEAALEKALADTALAEARERQRLAMELHDRLGQTLALAQIKFGTLRHAIPEGARGLLSECARLLDTAIADARSILVELRPPLLDELGLRAALLALADRLAEGLGLRVEVEGPDLPALDRAVASILFRVVRELLVNVAKHARSPSARVVLRVDGDRAEIEVVDDGVGFDPGAMAEEGFGLPSARGQIAGLGGTMEITSSPGGGTQARLSVPLAPHAA